MKHVERPHYFIRECVEDMKLVVPFVRWCVRTLIWPTSSPYTKPLDNKRFFELRNSIMNYNQSD